MTLQEDDESLERVNSDLRQSRQLGRQISGALDIPRDRLELIGEHLANVIVEWLVSLEGIDLEKLSVRDFTALTRLLIDLRKIAGKDEGGNGKVPTGEQLEAIEQTLIGAGQ